MHELSVANSIVEIVTSHPSAITASRVRRIRLRIGEASGVAAASLELCFRGLTEGTKLAGAGLDIESVPFALSCRSCGAKRRADPALMLCPACGSTEVQAAAGYELDVLSIDIEREKEDSA